MQRCAAWLALACLLLCTGISFAAPAPGCVCAAVYDPVCGKDGQEYSNSCQAGCAGVAVAYQGNCRTALQLPFGVNIGGATAGADDCLCTRLFNPVCGEDDQTYTNECTATCAGISVQYDGECKTASGKTASSITQEDAPAPAAPAVPAASPTAVQLGPVTLSLNPQAGCVCAALYQPVCGTDGKTYPNACEANCKGVKVASQGECQAAVATSGTAATPTASSPAAAATAVKATSVSSSPASSSSGCVCAAVFDPVCGEDGRNYGNACEASCAGVAVARKGGCGATDSASTDSSSGGSGCVCPMVYEPVCTKKGATRSNKCMADCKGETVAYAGPCGAKEPSVVEEIQDDANGTAAGGGNGAVPAAASTPDKTANAAAPKNGTASAACPAACPVTYEPVCGADGVTYPSKCSATCEGNTTVAYANVCGSRPTGNVTVSSATGLHSSGLVSAALAVLCLLAVLM